MLLAVLAYLYYCILGVFLKFDLFYGCPKEYYDILIGIKLLVLQF